MRCVTFYYNLMTHKVSDLKVHNNKEVALSYFNENGRKYFKQFTPITADAIPVSCGSSIHQYIIASVEEFEEAFNCSIAEYLKLAKNEDKE